jgi:FtsZ-binding cell division protein ZapB
MNSLFQLVDLLDKKLNKLLDKYNNLQLENTQLIEQKNRFDEELTKQHRLISDLERKHESLKVANAIVGSKEDKHLTKLKINTLIREIDKCIVHLSN